MPYNPTRIYTRRRNAEVAENIGKWRENLGYLTFKVTMKTLECTTRYVSTVEAKTREYMRDHFKFRIMSLQPHRLNDVCVFRHIFFKY